MREIPAQVIALAGRPGRLAALGLLAGLAVLLQLGPVYWPGGGYLLAMAATLPTAVAAAIAPHRSPWFFLAAGFLIGMAAVEEMFVFLTATGPLGLVLGMTVRRPAWQATLAAGALLTGGLLLMPQLAGVLPWGGVERAWSLPVRALAYAVFSLVYAGLWRKLFDIIWLRLQRALPARYTGGDEL